MAEQSIPIAIVGGKDTDDRTAAFAALCVAVNAPLTLVAPGEMDPAECVLVSHSVATITSMDLSGARVALARAIDAVVAVGERVGDEATLDVDAGLIDPFHIIFANYRWDGGDDPSDMPTRSVRPVLPMHKAWRALLGEV